MDEDFVFKISLVLLCISLLLSMIVLFLIAWLAKIHHQVDSISKGWSVYCRLTPNQKTPTTENQPEAQDTCSPLPLVFFNQQAADSDIVNSWKNINRAFAYAPVRSEVDTPRPKTEETDFALHVENNKSGDDSKTQEQTVRISNVPVTSYLQIVDNSSPIVAISTNECPIKDVKQDKRRIHVSGSSADDVNDDNYPESLKDCAQAEPEKMPLVDEEDSVIEDLKICSRSGADEQHISLKKNDTSGTTKRSDTGRTDSVSVVSSEENRKGSAEFCIELHNTTSTKFDEQCNGKSSQEIKTENKASGRVMDCTKLPNENGYVAVTHSDESVALSEDSKKEIPCPGDESEHFISTKTRSKGKKRRKKKSVTGGMMNSDGKNGSGTRKGVAPLDNVNESTQCVEQMGKTGSNSASDFQQTQPHTGEKVKSSAVSDNDGYQIVSYVNQFVVTNEGTSAPLTQEYHAESVSESDEKMKPEDRKQDKYNDDYATNEDATERNGSPGIVSQLRDLLKRKSLIDSAHSVDRENKITVEDDTTESLSKDDYSTVVQENEAHVKNVGEEFYSTATDLEDRQIPAEPEIYSHVDEGNDDLYCEIPAAAKSGVINVNRDDNENVGNGFSDEVPIYANIGPEHGTAIFNGNQALENEYEFVIFSNNTIDV